MRWAVHIDYDTAGDLIKSAFAQRWRTKGASLMADLVTTDYLEIDPAQAERRQVYRMLVGSVVPRPIGWASTVDLNGRSNLAPFSFFTVVCVVPPMISLTIARNPDGSEKHTLKNVRQTGEFCFNIVTEPVWKEMVDSANGFPEGDSEFDKTGLTPIPCVKMKPPRVAEVPIHFECKLHQVIELGPNRHPLVIGEVVFMHVDPACMTNGYIDMRAQPGRPPQRLLLHDAWRDSGAQIRRRPAPITGIRIASFSLGRAVSWPARITSTHEVIYEPRHLQGRAARRRLGLHGRRRIF